MLYVHYLCQLFSLPFYYFKMQKSKMNKEEREKEREDKEKKKREKQRKLYEIKQKLQIKELD